VAAGRGLGKEACARAALCRGWHLQGQMQKYGILKKRLKRFTVHTNVIVVNIRISIGDLIAGVGDGNTDVCPRRKTPSCRH